MNGTECGICGRRSADTIPYCFRCADTFRAELMAVPGLVADLDITGDRLDKLGRSQPGGKSPETPIPIRLGRDGFPANYGRPLADLTAVITGWAGKVATAAGLAHVLADAVTSPPSGLERLVLNNRPGRNHRYDPTELTTHPIRPVEIAAVWLAHNPRPLRAVPDVAWMHDDVTVAVERIRRIVDRLPERTLRGPCPYVGYDHNGDRKPCGARLYAERGEEWVRCPKCGAQHELRRLESAALRAAENELFELSQIRILLEELGEPVPKSTLYAWANDPRRKRLKPRGWRRPSGTVTDVWIDRRDTPMYRLGDVRTVREKVEAEKQREAKSAASATLNGAFS